MTEATWQRVGRALLGRWPSQVASWGEDGIAAFVEELQAEGLSPADALVGIRSHRPERDFPPSVAAVSRLARRDTSQPTPEEAFELIYGRGGVMKARTPLNGSYANEAAMLGARDNARLERAFELHPLLGAFVQRFGMRRLAMLEVDHPDYGEMKRRDLREAWERHCVAFEGREIATIARASGREGLRRLDPLERLNIAPTRVLNPGTGA